jgi:hypothetical protein
MVLILCLPACVVFAACLPACLPAMWRLSAKPAAFMMEHCLQHVDTVIVCRYAMQL